MGCLYLLIVEVGKMHQAETILAENGPSIDGPAFQQLHLIFATVISTHELVIDAPRICQSAKLLSQFKSHVQKTLNLAFIIIGRLGVVPYATAHSHVF